MYNIDTVLVRTIEISQIPAEIPEKIAGIIEI
jgi:hypothetical protein